MLPLHLPYFHRLIHPLLHPQVEVKTQPYKEGHIHQQHPVTPLTYLGPRSSDMDLPRVEKYDVV